MPTDPAATATIDRPPLTFGRTALRLAVSLGLTGLLGWWAFRGIRWNDALKSLSGAEWRWLVPHLVLLTVLHLLRAWRCGPLLSGLGRLSFRALNAATAVGNMLFVLLPLRLGEFARPMAIARQSEISASAAMAALTLERILDGLSLAVLLEVTLPWLPADAPGLTWIKGGAHLMLALFAGVLLVFVALGRFESLTLALADRVLGWMPQRVSAPAGRIVREFVAATRRLPSPRQLLLAVALTLGIWVTNALAIVALARAFSCRSGGCQPLELTTLQGFLVLAVTTVSGLVPAAPGSAGTFQAGVKASLLLFTPAAVVNGTGLAFANVLWLTTNLIQVVIGVLFSIAEPVGTRAASSSTATRLTPLDAHER